MIIGRAPWDCDGCGRKNTGQSGPSKLVIPMQGLQAGNQAKPCIMRFCVDCAPCTHVQLAMVAIPKEVERPGHTTKSEGDLDQQQHASMSTLEDKLGKGEDRPPCECPRPNLGPFDQATQSWPCAKCGGLRVLESSEIGNVNKDGS